MAKFFQYTCLLYILAFSAQAADRVTVDPVSIAFDGFESGNLSVGSGSWGGAWFASGDVGIRTNRNQPQAGDNHVRFLSNSGLLQRQIDLSGLSDVRLRFWAKINSFENSDIAEVKVSPDGLSFTTVEVLTASNSDNQYHYFDIDLSTFPMTAGFVIAFEAGMSGTRGRWYLDDVEILGRVQAAGRSLKKVGVNLYGNSYWSTALPVGNAMKTASKWFASCAWPCPWDTGEVVTDLDANGYPMRLPAADDPRQYRFVHALLLRNDKHPAGEYVVLYDGEGEIAYRFSATKNVAKSVPGRHVIDVTSSDGSGVDIMIRKTNPANHIRNIRIVYPRGNDGDLFHPRFIEDLKVFSAIRYMQAFDIVTSQIVSWEERQHLDDVRWDVFPYEWAIALANETNTDPWFNIVARADDHHVRQFARLAHGSLGSNLTVYLEYMNELWNNAYPYNINGKWVEDQGEMLWPGSGFKGRLNWYAKRTVEICKIWREEWGVDSARINCVMGSQAANSWLGDTLLNCDLYAVNLGGRGGKCSDVVDSLAIAPYILADTNLELDQMFASLNSEGLARVIAMRDANQAVADQHGVELITYEAGQHLIGGNGLQANRDPRMADIYAKYQAIWDNKLLMHYHFTGSWTDQYGSWGLKEYQMQTDAYKYNAVRDYVNN